MQFQPPSGVRVGGRARRAALAAPVLGALLAAMWFFGWHAYNPASRSLVYERPLVSGGDELAYTMVIHSILFDHDLELRDDFGRVRAGGLNAGIGFRGQTLFPHTWLVDSHGRHQLFWDAYNSKDDRAIGCHGWACASDHALAQRSAHPIAYPLIIAALCALVRATPAEVEPVMAVSMLCFAWLGAILTFLCTRRLGARFETALVATAALCLCSPWLIYSRSFFPEMTAALFVVGGWYLFQRERWLECGVAIGIAAAVKPALALIAIGFLIERARARAWPQFCRLAAGSGALGLAVVALNFQQAHTLIISGNMGWSWISKVSDASRTLVDTHSGLLLFAPWALLGLIALAVAARRGEAPAATRAAAWAVGLSLALFSVFGYVGQICYGSRYWIPLLPFLAATGAVFVDRGPRWLKGLAVMLMMGGGIVNIPAALVYRFTWNQPFYRGLGLVARSLVHR